MNEHIIPFPGVVTDLREALALQERRALAREVRYEASLVLASFAARAKLSTVPEVRLSETGIIVYAEEFQAIRYGGLCGMVSQLAIQTAHDIRRMCQKVGVTFAYGDAVAPAEPEVPVRECKVRPTGFRPPQLPLQPEAVLRLA